MVLSALAELQDEVTVLVDSEHVALPLDATYPSADFVVETLDVRVRLVMSLETHSVDEIVADGEVMAAASLLSRWPDTAAVCIVANAEDLACVIVDPYGAGGSLETPTGDLSEGPSAQFEGPLVPTLNAYLHALLPEWEQLPSVPLSGEPGLFQPDELREALGEVVEERRARGRRAHIEERKSAYQSVSSDDLDWALATLARAVGGSLTGELLSSQVRERGELE